MYEKEFQKLRTHQLKAVDAIKIVDSVCQKHKIDYFFIAGSTLGAVRHKGFIPWDDDIDIGMTMSNYNRFIKIIHMELTKPYEWKHTTVDEQYATLSGRISIEDEPLITIFPIVKLSDNLIQRKSQWMIRKIFSPIWQRKVGYHIPKSKIRKKDKFAIAVSFVLSHFMTKRFVLHVIRWNEMRFEKKDVTWCINLYSKYSMEKESIKTEWLKELIRVPYEDGKYPIVKEYDAYLKHIYGDYMKLPPEEERIPVHL